MKNLLELELIPTGVKLRVLPSNGLIVEKINNHQIIIKNLTGKPIEFFSGESSPGLNVDLLRIPHNDLGERVKISFSAEKGRYLKSVRQITDLICLNQHLIFQMRGGKRCLVPIENKGKFFSIHVTMTDGVLLIIIKLMRKRKYTPGKWVVILPE